MASGGGRGSTRSRRSPRTPSPPRSAASRSRGTRRGAWRAAARATRSALQVPPSLLLALQRLEQRLEVALAEATRAVPLDHLEEQRRAVANRLGEDLEQVSLVVAVDEDAEAPQVGDALVDLAHSLRHIGVVGLGD